MSLFPSLQFTNNLHSSFPPVDFDSWSDWLGWPPQPLPSLYCSVSLFFSTLCSTVVDENLNSSSSPVQLLYSSSYLSGLCSLYPSTAPRGCFPLWSHRQQPKSETVEVIPLAFTVLLCEANSPWSPSLFLNVFSVIIICLVSVCFSKRLWEIPPPAVFQLHFHHVVTSSAPSPARNRCLSSPALLIQSPGPDRYKLADSGLNMGRGRLLRSLAWEVNSKLASVDFSKTFVVLNQELN